MNSCIHCHSPIFSLLSHHKFNQQPHTPQLLWFTSNQPTRPMNKQNTCMKTRAIPITTTTTLLLGVSSPGKPDVLVFLGTSAVLLFVYWISNFVVPPIILKDLLSDQTSEDQKPSADNNLVDFDKQSTSEDSKSTRRKKKRGFKSIKR